MPETFEQHQFDRHVLVAQSGRRGSNEHQRLGCAGSRRSAAALSGRDRGIRLVERRRKAREEVDDLLNRRPGSVSGRRAAAEREQARRPPAPKPLSPEAQKLRKAYRDLEVPETADFETVRRAYRDLMRKYHPDRHTGSPEKLRAANEVAQKLTEAYKLLEKQLRK